MNTRRGAAKEGQVKKTQKSEKGIRRRTPDRGTSLGLSESAVRGPWKQMHPGKLTCRRSHTVPVQRPLSPRIFSMNALYFSLSPLCDDEQTARTYLTIRLERAWNADDPVEIRPVFCKQPPGTDHMFEEANHEKPIQSLVSRRDGASPFPRGLRRVQR